MTQSDTSAVLGVGVFTPTESPMIYSIGSDIERLARLEGRIIELEARINMLYSNRLIRLAIWLNKLLTYIY